MKSSILTYNIVRFAPHFLLGVMILSIGIYVYSVNSIARSTALRESIESEIGALSNAVGDLEAEYALKTKNITLENIESFGLVEIKNPVFVSRSGNVTALVGYGNAN